MDPLTHALASYSLKRAALPRATRSVTVVLLVAGTIADLDNLSGYLGPSPYFTFYRTCGHSLLAALLLSALVLFLFFLLKPKPTDPAISHTRIFIAALAAALLHLAMDLTQTSGVGLLWPFSSRRFALDWVPHLDLWILGILLAGILLPLLSGLVTEEIGGRSKSPRGKLGATLAFAALFLYITVRFVYHGNALAAIKSRTYRGESARRVAAFAESSPFIWHGIVETERALHDVDVPVGPGGEFDPAAARTIYKPEPSPVLEAARASSVARRFLQVARFPKASVEQTATGYQVTLRDFPYDRDSNSGWRVLALVNTDSSGKILSQELAWVSASHNVSLKD